MAVGALARPFRVQVPHIQPVGKTDALEQQQLTMLDLEVGEVGASQVAHRQRGRAPAAILRHVTVRISCELLEVLPRSEQVSQPFELLGVRNAARNRRGRAVVADHVIATDRDAFGRADGMVRHAWESLFRAHGTDPPHN